MANTFELITKYMTGAIDSILVGESKTAILDNGSKWVDVNFNEAGYVKVASRLMDGLSDYYRVNNGTLGSDYVHKQDGGGDGYKKANIGLKWEVFPLRYDRGAQAQVDSMDDEEAAGLVIANLATDFTREKVVPEIDATTFSTIAGKCSASLGNYKVETIADNKVLKGFTDAFVWMKNHGVPDGDQIIYVSATLWGKILNSTELTRYITQMDYRSNDITFNVNGFMGRPIIVVEEDRFFTDVECGANGYYATDDSKVINYMVVSRKAVIPIKKLQIFKIFGREVVQDFDGYKFNYRLYHDCVIPKNKVVASYCSVSSVAANTVSRLLDVLLEEGSASGATKVTEYYSEPAGIFGDLYFSTSAVTVGGTKDSKAVAVTVGEDFINDATSGYFFLADASGKIVAASGSVTLVKKS